MVTYLNLVELVSGKLTNPVDKKSLLPKVELAPPSVPCAATPSTRLKSGFKRKIANVQFTVELLIVSVRLLQKKHSRACSKDGVVQCMASFSSMRLSSRSRAKDRVWD